MGEAYRGLTIRFKADGTKVMSTLKAMRKAGADVESELRLVNRALKFDGANSNAAARQLKLMAERAGAAGAEAKLLDRELRQLGKMKFDGVEVKKLSEYTKNASTQAAIMRERYMEADKSLAKMHRQAEQLWKDAKLLSNTPNPFKDWSNWSTDELIEFYKVLRNVGAIGNHEFEQMTSSLRMLRTEFNATGQELRKLNRIAAFQSGEDKLLQLEAAAKRYRNALRDAALQARETGHEFNLTRASESLERTSAAAKRLKEAMRLDPKSFEAAIGHAKMLKAEMGALESSSDELRAEIKQLEAMPGVKELANDAKRLQEEFIASGKAVDLASEKLGKANASLNACEKRAADLRHQLDEAGDTASTELKSNFEQAEQELSQARKEANILQQEFDQVAASADKVNAALRVTDNRTQIAANNAKMQAMNQKQAKKSLMSTSAMTSLGMSMYATVYPAAMMAGSYAIQAAQEVDSAYRDMRKTVQGTETDFENLKRKALEFGDTHVTSADQILEFEAMGGQLGVLVDDLEAFSTTVANLDIATNMDSDEIALDLGKMASILQISSDEYDNFADALVRLGNSEPALESDIMAITARFGAMAHIVGMTPDQILAIATAATATGQKAEAAGGALQRLLGGIETKVAGVSEAMKELDWEGEDLEEFQEAAGNLEAFANVAGMTADQFAQAWEHDAAGAFQKFIEGLKKYGEEGGSVQALLYDELGYHNVRDLQLLQGLTNTTQVMTESLSMAANAYKGYSDQFGAAGDAEREAAKKAEGFSGQLQILKNNGQHMADMLGESLLPLMKELTGVIQSGTSFFEGMGDGAKQVALGFVGLAVALGPALTFTASLRNAIGSVSASMKEYASAESTLARMDGSFIMRATGLNDAYKKNADAIARNVEKMESYRSEQLAIVGSTDKEIARSKELSKQRRALAQENKSLARNNKMMAVGGGALGALKSVGAMAGIGIGIALVEQLITKFVEAKAKADEFKAATEGVGSIAKAMESMDDDIAGGVKGKNGEYDSTAIQVQNLVDKTHELTSANADFSRSAIASLDEMRGNAIMAEYWGQKVLGLSSNFDGSATQLEQLKTAIEQYNEVTGSNVKLVDEQTGRLNVNRAAIEQNTAAFKSSIEAQAYRSVAEEAAKSQAEVQVQLEMTKQKLEELDEVMRNSEYSTDENSEYQKAWKESQELKESQAELEAQLPGLQAAMDTAYTKAQEKTEAARVEAEKLNETLEKSQSATAYAEALNKIGDGQQILLGMAESAGYTSDTLDEFANALAEAGIETGTLADLGTEAFDRLLASCGNDLENLNGLINSLNNAGIDPKTVTVTEEGALEVKGHIIDLQNMTIDGKSFTVTANGVEGADEETNNLLKDVGILDKESAEPNAELQDNASDKIAAIAKALADLDGDSATTTVYENTIKTTYHKTIDQGTEKAQQATGGIQNTLLRKIPMHADGGALSGIVTRATLTNQGWVGEDGAEALLRMGRQTAVVPLTNTHYVRPFARAVASEMPGSSGSSTVNNYYSLNGLTVAAGSEESRALEVLAGTMRRGRRGHGR